MATLTRRMAYCQRILLVAEFADNRKYLARLPGGHQEGWADAFRNVMAEIYGLILEGKGMPKTVPPPVATFEDGYRTNCIVDSLLESNAAGGVWTKVRY